MKALTLRMRLTLLYTGLAAICGAAIVIMAYILVPGITYSGPEMTRQQNEFIQMCTSLPQENWTPKCQAAYEEGQLAGAQQQRQATLDRMLWYSAFTFAGTTMLAGLIGWMVAGRALRPVHQISAAARKASQDNLSARVAIANGPRDELRELADTFDEMLARLEASFKTQKLFIANASHELRTPLTVMRTALDVVLAKPQPSVEELRGMGTEVRTAVADAERLIDALLTLARNEHGMSHPERVDLATIAEDALDAADPGDRQIQPSLQPAVVEGDPVLLERLVANLLENALRYNDNDGRVWVNTTAAGQCATLTVANTGPEVPAEAAAKLLEPFRRLNNRTGREGSGLGLAIVASITQVHKGSVTVQPRPDGGLSVEVTLPLAGTITTTAGSTC